jgi:uncharacterized protein YegL
MAFQKLTANRATSLTPQVVTLIVDDSGSMRGAKATQATDAMKDLVTTMQSGNQGASGFRFLLNVAKFGTATTPLAEAVPPDAISLASMSFSGTSGNTEMAIALGWGAEAVKKGLEQCRRINGYREAEAPSPLVVFFSDGGNTGGDVNANAAALRNISFAGGQVDVVAVGIGMEQKDFPIMERVASRPDLAVNIDPSQLSEFIATVGATVLRGEGADDLVAKFDQPGP